MRAIPSYRLRIFALAFATLLIAYSVICAPPQNFPKGTIVVIRHGDTATDITQSFSAKQLIAHPGVLSLIFRVTGWGDTIQSGAYSFAIPENVLLIAYRLSHGEYGIPSAHITFFEGMTVREYAKKIADALPEISAEDFIAYSTQYEGYLFPDTYVFAPGVETEDIVRTMRTTFMTKTASLRHEAETSKHTFSDSVIMASLIEKEARTIESKRMVAGILWHRLSIGMPLQVDAVFGYIFNRDTYSPSYADLKVQSPYNTYTHAGLPPGPIANPGLESIDAALHPTETDYLYYLTGRDGAMHYATTYAQHLANQKRYLAK